MIIRKIDTGDEIFYCKSGVDEFIEHNKDWLPLGTTVELVEMTENEYNNMLTTQRAAELFPIAKEV